MTFPLVIESEVPLWLNIISSIMVWSFFAIWGLAMFHILKILKELVKEDKEKKK